MGVGNISTDRIQQADAAPIEKPYREFRGLQTRVHPEGEDARVTIQTTTGRISLTVPFEYIAQANTEIRRAAILMLYRQSMKKDAGQNAFDELLSTALVPAEVGVMIDKKTGDRLFVMQFDGHSPIVVRMSPEAVHTAMVAVAEQAKITAN